MLLDYCERGRRDRRLNRVRAVLAMNKQTGERSSRLATVETAAGRIFSGRSNPIADPCGQSPQRSSERLERWFIGWQHGVDGLLSRAG